MSAAFWAHGTGALDLLGLEGAGTGSLGASRGAPDLGITAHSVPARVLPDSERSSAISSLLDLAEFAHLGSVVRPILGCVGSIWAVLDVAARVGVLRVKFVRSGPGSLGQVRRLGCWVFVAVIVAAQVRAPDLGFEAFGFVPRGVVGLPVSSHAFTWGPDFQTSRQAVGEFSAILVLVRALLVSVRPFGASPAAPSLTRYTA